MKPCLPFVGGQLRPMQIAHRDHVTRILRHRDVRRFLCDDRQVSREEVTEMLKSSENLEDRGLGLWIIETGHTTVAGVIGLEPVSEILATIPGMAGQIEPVIALDPRHTGGGLATRALNRLISHARTSLQLSGLVAAVDEPNHRSHRLMRRCGFKSTGHADGPAHRLALYAFEFEDPGN
ncbi:MAG: GNAT family N-acetyltransferase [Alphaproteobacteria bacterium]|nr:GNAT family N-acetyltransferase [Alphaproteobacteria bacterium]